LESLGFELGSRAAYWEDRLRELADYRKIHGHCNVPQNYSENTQLGNWVGNQRTNYKLQLDGNPSPMTLSRIQELESLGFEWVVQYVCVTPWEDRLRELADYRKIHGHCNVPQNYAKLGTWVDKQRQQYRLQLEGKTSPTTLSRIQELESLGFEWDCSGATWEDRLRELADYRKIHGHCNVPQNYSENTKLGYWVTRQRTQYKMRAEGKTSSMTLSRNQELESLGFEWVVQRKVCVTVWEKRLSELADYRKIHGHCNVPQNYAKLSTWVHKQRQQYRLQLEGKTSPMTLSRIQELESLGFELGSRAASWKDRLRELADYRKIHGHCNVPHNYSENSKLGCWVSTQRTQYKLRAEGKKSQITLPRIQELESLGFEWGVCVRTAWEDRLSELADYRKIHGHCYSENTKLATWVATQRTNYRLHLEGKKSQMTLPRIQVLESLGFEWKRSIGQGST
jgi:predicted chitinase